MRKPSEKETVHEIINEEVFEDEADEGKVKESVKRKTEKSSVEWLVIIALYIGVIMAIIELLFGKGVNNAICALVSGLVFSVFIREAVRYKKTWDIIMAVTHGVFTIIYSVGWVISLFEQ